MSADELMTTESLVATLVRRLPAYCYRYLERCWYVHTARALPLRHPHSATRKIFGLTTDLIIYATEAYTAKSWRLVDKERQIYMRRWIRAYKRML